MNDYLKVAALAALVVPLTALGTWLARTHPWRGWRTATALMTTGFASSVSMDIGCRLSSLRGPWTVYPGYSCGEAKILCVLLIFGAVVLIRVVWRSIRVEEGAATRASKLTVACLGLVLVGFTFFESESAHERFHQVHHQSETQR